MSQRKKPFSHVLVRLPGPMKARLAERQRAMGKRTIAPVVEALLKQRFERGNLPCICARDPSADLVNDLFICRQVVDDLRRWASERNVNMGDMAYTVLAEELNLPTEQTA